MEGDRKQAVSDLTNAISICIPTFNRPQLIRETIESCFDQAYRPLEILIGDDSSDDRTEKFIRSFEAPAGIFIRYERNGATLGQSRNVNRLFQRASGVRLVLLHDDDLMCPGGLDRLVCAFDAFPRARCVYGLQHVVSADGRILEDRSVEWNKRDRRTPDHGGPQSSPLKAALWQHVPNDGYLIESGLARRIGYRDEARVGHAVDADFIIEVAKNAGEGEFVFIEDFVSKYRLTPGSIARSQTINRHQDLFFASLLEDEDLDAEAEARDRLLERIATGAALDAAMAGRRSDALRLLFSRYYDKPYASRWTLYRLLCVLSPPLGVFIRRVIGGG